MSTKVAAKDPELQARRALYYPYMQPRNEEWVKATLLAFGQISRIVPSDYPLEDLPDVAFLAMQKTKLGLLIRNISPDWSDIEAAQLHLASKLQRTNTKQLQQRFGKERTVADFGSAEGFQIHEHKLHDSLLRLLDGASLAWSPEKPSTRLGRWRGVHPYLGEAIMSVTSIAAARRKSLDLVTENTQMHAALASLEEAHVLDALLGDHVPAPPAPGDAAQATDRLGHIIMTTSLDVTRIRKEDVAEIVEDSADVRTFRQELAGLVTAVPNDAPPEERERALRTKAEELVSRWLDAQRSWHQRLRSAFGDPAKSEFQQRATQAAESILSAAASGGLAAALGTVGSASMQTLAVGAGISIAVGAAFASEGKVVASKDEPVRYLTRVHEAGVSIVVSPTRVAAPRRVPAS
ncbi:MAG: hypothetical protein WKG00_06680 [Polyangiaceae bacterium]